MAGSFHDFLHECDISRIPEPMIALGRRWLLDLIGVAAGGSPTALSRIIRDHAAEQFAPGRAGASMLFDGREVSPAGAALAGGMTIDALDAHDGHKLTKGHVGCGVFPGLLSVSEANDALDDRAFLAGLVIGYEIGTRAGIALHRTAADYHTSGAWVAVTVAALAARVMGLDANRTREAIGIAEYHGPRSQMMRGVDHPTMVKDGSGWGAMAGVSAAYLARDGFTGAPAVTVEGADVADLWADLGTNWRIEEQYFKLYPVCRWAQPAVQAVIDLRERHGITSKEVERIEITTFHQSLRLATRTPATTEQAQYSTAFPAAVAMVRGRVAPEDVMEASFADPEIRRLAEGVSMIEDSEYNAAFPARRFSRVTLFLEDGRKLESGTTEALGDPENPVPMSTVERKYRLNALPVLGERRTDAIAREVAALGDGRGLTPLLELLQPPAGETGAVAA